MLVFEIFEITFDVAVLLITFVFCVFVALGPRNDCPAQGEGFRGESTVPSRLKWTLPALRGRTLAAWSLALLQPRGDPGLPWRASTGSRAWGSPRPRGVRCRGATPPNLPRARRRGCLRRSRRRRHTCPDQLPRSRSTPPWSSRWFAHDWTAVMAN